MKSILEDIKRDLKELRKDLMEIVIAEGVDDPGILKCIFLAGGPGSGKSFAVKEIFGVSNLNKVSASGLKLVNSDGAFETALKKKGISPKDLAKIAETDPEFYDTLTGEEGDSVRNRAVALTKKQQEFYEMGRLGMIIDGTGDDVVKIQKKKEKAESLGYDCYMVFVNTSLDVALKRNAERDRTLPENVVKEIWNRCQENIGKFQAIFGNNFTIVDNTQYKPVEADVKKKVNQFISLPIRNIIGRRWIDAAREIKKRI